MDLYHMLIYIFMIECHGFSFLRSFYILLQLLAETLDIVCTPGLGLGSIQSWSVTKSEQGWMFTALGQGGGADRAHIQSWCKGSGHPAASILLEQCLTVFWRFH